MLCRDKKRPLSSDSVHIVATDDVAAYTTQGIGDAVSLGAQIDLGFNPVGLTRNAFKDVHPALNGTNTGIDLV